MDKKEFHIIGFGIGVLIPLLLLVLFWWPIAALKIYAIVSFPESLIKISAAVGFFAGVIIDILFLKRLIPIFYRFKISLMIIVYLFCSVIAVAFFMGFPVGNLLLGIIAGLYIGRKYHHLEQKKDKFPVVSKTTSIFTASITSLEALPIGFLIALQEHYLPGSINKFLGFRLFSSNTVIIFIIVILCLLLFIVQFYSTRAATKIAFYFKM